MNHDTNWASPCDHLRICHGCEGWIIRVYYEWEGRIEKSVPRIAIWHHKACQVMTNDDREGHIFLSYPHTNNGFFFLLTTVFIYLFILKHASRSP